jgi:hypothetical protein
MGAQKFRGITFEMNVRASLAVMALVASACGSRAEFRPAQGVGEAAPVRYSERVKSVRSECVALGVVEAMGAYALDDIATLAARHGGTHHVVRGNDPDGPEGMLGRSAGGEQRRLEAEVFRCPAQT